LYRAASTYVSRRRINFCMPLQHQFAGLILEDGPNSDLRRGPPFRRAHGHSGPHSALTTARLFPGVAQGQAAAPTIPARSERERQAALIHHVASETRRELAGMHFVHKVIPERWWLGRLPRTIRISAICRRMAAVPGHSIGAAVVIFPVTGLRAATIIIPWRVPTVVSVARSPRICGRSETTDHGSRDQSAGESGAKSATPAAAVPTTSSLIE
jgi:hypothetical protein